MIEGNAGNDILTGYLGDDWLHGGTGNDRLRAGPGDDSLAGSDGNDTLLAAAGDDTLSGGGGNDFLVGGSGADVFVVSAEPGRDVVHDFHQGEDLLDLRLLAGVGSFADVSMAQTGRSVTLDFSDMGGGEVLVRGMSLEDLGTDDFLF